MIATKGNVPRLLWLGWFRPIKFAFRRLPCCRKFKRSFRLLPDHFLKTLSWKQSGIDRTSPVNFRPKPTQVQTDLITGMIDLTLSQVECEQKTKRDKASGSVDDQCETSTKELPRSNCVLVAERTAQHRDKPFLAARKKLKVVADNVTKEKDAHSFTSGLDFARKQRKANEDDVGSGETVQE
ncbi:unnamed protein product [Adineta ricciae]|uniref:Uncharacterized protein n=1 Tax=Adineta ricciae TaxID=249248 RepID=A0A815UA67_ADIRI|nr:unnamed protein product [Adineta ricciae]